MTWGVGAITDNHVWLKGLWLVLINGWSSFLGLMLACTALTPTGNDHSHPWVASSTQTWTSRTLWPSPTAAARLSGIYLVWYEPLFSSPWSARDTLSVLFTWPMSGIHSLQNINSNFIRCLIFRVLVLKMKQQTEGIKTVELSEQISDFWSPYNIVARVQNLVKRFKLFFSPLAVSRPY